MNRQNPGDGRIFGVERRGDAIVATLKGIDSAPSRVWSRSKGLDGVTYSRELTAAECYRFFESGSLPEGFDNYKLETFSSLKKIRTFPAITVPCFHIEDAGPSIRLELAFKDPSRPEIVATGLPDGFDSDRGYTIIDHLWLAFDGEGFDTAVAAVEEVGLDVVDTELKLSFRQYLRLKSLLSQNEIPVVEEIGATEHVTVLQRQLQSFEVQVPDLLSAELYGYQQEGLRWLQFCYAHELGCLLGDDMGLGKTLTAIALMLGSARSDKPSLVVCPTTIMENWIREFRRFSPSLTILLHHGKARPVLARDLTIRDVVITSYGTLRNDIPILSQIEWNVVVLDEAQNIKNPSSGISASCRRLRARCPVAMTGTPFENKPLDLWGLMDFVEPGFLGTEEEFSQRFSVPIASGDSAVLNELEETVSLFLLRRLKSEVRSDLPEKIEIDQPVVMTALEVENYLHHVKTTKEAARLSGFFLNIMTPLRQLCCHPRLLDESWEGDPYPGCSKYAKLVGLLTNIVASGEKVMIFTSYLRMIDILETDLRSRFEVPLFRIDGRVAIEHRQGIVDCFSEVSRSAILVLNPLAGGVGLNIVAANHVIHYNREWNPAVEAQATDRAYRIGQNKDVMVHYLFYVETIDEIISDRLSEKRLLGGQLVKSSDDKEADREALLAALELIPTRSLEDIGYETLD